jgi:hypothetical protein
MIHTVIENESDAISFLHEKDPTATIEPFPGNPNIMGYYVFKVYRAEFLVVYVSEHGEILERTVS